MPGPRQFSTRREVFEDRQQNAQEQARVQAHRLLRQCPFLRGTLKSVSFVTGGATVVVTHGLGVPAACFPVRFNYDPGGAMNGPAFAEVLPIPANVDQKNQLALVCNQNTVTVDLWFYPRSSVRIPVGKSQSP